MSEKKPRGWWDSFGKIFRGRKGEVPPGMNYCDNCGRIFPEEDLYLVYVRGIPDELHLCEECIEKPPSTWANRFGYNRKKEEEEEEG